MAEVKAKNKKINNVYRDGGLLTSQTMAFPLQKIQSLSWTAVVVFALAILATSSSGTASIWTLFGDNEGAERTLSSTFPQISSEDDTSDILRSYPAYLAFVLDVGRRTDANTAHRLEDTYGALRKRYPDAAAQFLKGLRFEMVAKLELMGASPSSVSSTSPEMRRWVTKFMRDWVREADEHLFRAVAANKGRSRRSE